jgi:hypothetical protein
MNGVPVSMKRVVRGIPLKKARFRAGKAYAGLRPGHDHLGRFTRTRTETEAHAKAALPSHETT